MGRVQGRRPPQVAERSSPRPSGGLHALAKRIEGCGTTDSERLTDGVRCIEPHEAKQPVKASSGEQVSYLRWLVGRWHRRGLSNEYRVASQLTHGNDGWPEQRRKYRGPFGVVTIDSHPGHIRAAGPPGYR